MRSSFLFAALFIISLTAYAEENAEATSDMPAVEAPAAEEAPAPAAEEAPAPAAEEESAVED
jgi:hypothetical protein